MFTRDSDFFEFYDAMLETFEAQGFGKLCSFHAMEFMPRYSRLECAPTTVGEAFDKLAHSYTEEEQHQNGVMPLLCAEIREMMSQELKDYMLSEHSKYFQGALTLRCVFGDTLPPEIIQNMRDAGVTDELYNRYRNRPQIQRMKQEW